MLVNISAEILPAFEIRQAILEISFCNPTTSPGTGNKKAMVEKTIVGSNKCKESLQFSGRALVILLTDCKDFLSKIGVTRPIIHYSYYFIDFFSLPVVSASILVLFVIKPLGPGPIGCVKVGSLSGHGS